MPPACADEDQRVLDTGKLQSRKKHSEKLWPFKSGIIHPGAICEAGHMAILNEHGVLDVLYEQENCRDHDKDGNKRDAAKKGSLPVPFFARKPVIPYHPRH
jgi:hypothetical protein